MPACLNNNGSLRLSQMAYVKKMPFLCPLLYHQLKSNFKQAETAFILFHLFFYAPAA